MFPSSRVAAKVRLDHALAALLVPPPTMPVISAIRAILELHNPIGKILKFMYEQCEELAEAELDKILRQLQEAPDVRVAPAARGIRENEPPANFSAST